MGKNLLSPSCDSVQQTKPIALAIRERRILVSASFEKELVQRVLSFIREIIHEKKNNNTEGSLGYTVEPFHNGHLSSGTEESGRCREVQVIKS